MAQLTPDQVASMRRLIAQNPMMTQTLIQQIAATNPELIQQLGDNAGEIISQALGGGGEGGEDDDGEGVPPGSHVLSVTPEERAAIERVGSLYSSRKRALI